MRAVPTAAYLVLLSEAGVLRAPGKIETECQVDLLSGEMRCEHSGAPDKDCRVPQCPYANLMRMRLIGRLGKAYAHERRKHVGQS